MKKIYFILVIIFDLIFYGCEKSIDQFPEFIIVGNTEDVKIQYHEVTITGDYYDPEYYDADLDNDGTKDIRFESEIWGSPAVGQLGKSKILSLHDDIQIYGYYANDTSFVRRSIDTVNRSDNSVGIYNCLEHSCYRVSNDDSVSSVNPSFKLVPLEIGDNININDTYKSDTIVLNDESYRFPASMYKQISQDTIYVEYSTFLNNCYTFPCDKVKYIGFRFESSSRLGWIRVGVFDRYKISIIESAIQK